MATSGVSVAKNKIQSVSNSSSIKAFRYDSENLILYVRFSEKAVYMYYNVPQTLVDDVFNSSPSIGRSFRQRINGYPYQRLNGNTTEV
jgi:hypothetical protein